MPENMYKISGTITSKGNTNNKTAHAMFEDLTRIFGENIAFQKEKFLKEGILSLDNIDIEDDILTQKSTVKNTLVNFIHTYTESIGDIHFIAHGESISDIWRYQLYPDDSFMRSKATIDFYHWDKVC